MCFKVEGYVSGIIFIKIVHPTLILGQEITTVHVVCCSFLVDDNGVVYEGRGWRGAVPPPKDRPEWLATVIVIAQVSYRLGKEGINVR